MTGLRELWAVVVLGLATGATASRAEGAGPASQTWEGTLKVGPAAKIRLVFHVREGPDRTLRATMDSPDQGASDIPVDAVERDKARLSFTLTKLGAKFEGSLNAAGTEAVGTFSQGGGEFPLTLKKKAEAPADVAAAAAREQVWEGKLKAGPLVSLRVILHLREGPAGALNATFDSPDQGANGLNVDSVALVRSRLSFELKAIKAKFEGTLNSRGDEAVGIWTQAGNGQPLTLKKVEKLTEVLRPQTPKPPFPYRVVEVTYPNKAGKVTLAGTLTVPKGAGPFPAALLISGSGAQDRDETIFMHKPFAVIADALSRRGVAVLRVDDRGVGGSSGRASDATTDDFAADALAGVAFLKSRREIDPRAIGLIGHSEGGLIAPIAAVRSRSVAFIVLLAGTGLPGDEVLYRQGRLVLNAMGAPKEAVEFQRALQERLFAVIKAEKDPKAVSPKLREAMRAAIAKIPEDQKKAAGISDALFAGQLRMLESPWFRYFVTYDPRPALAKVRCPVLALVGEKDLQVSPKENLAEIEKTLKAAGNERVQVKQLPGLNHLFQTCRTGSVTEYAEIEETIAPSVLALIGDWVLEQVKER